MGDGHLKSDVILRDPFIIKLPNEVTGTSEGEEPGKGKTKPNAIEMSHLQSRQDNRPELSSLFYTSGTPATRTTVKTLESVSSNPGSMELAICRESLSPRSLADSSCGSSHLQPAAFDALKLSYDAVLKDLNHCRRLAKHYRSLCQQNKALVRELLKATGGSVDESQENPVSQLRDVIARQREEIEKLTKEKDAVAERLEILKDKSGIEDMSVVPFEMGLSAEMEMSQSAAGIDAGVLHEVCQSRDFLQTKYNKLRAEYDELLALAEAEKSSMAKEEEEDRKAHVIREEMSKLIVNRNKQIGELSRELADVKTEREELKLKLASSLSERKSEATNEQGNEEKTEEAHQKSESEKSALSLAKEILNLKEDLSHAQTSLIEALEDKRVNQERLRMEHDLAEEHRRGVQELEKRQHGLIQQIDSLTHDKEELKREAAIAETSFMTEKRALKKEKDDLKRQLASCQNASHWLKTDLKKASLDRDALQSRLNELESSRSGGNGSGNGDSVDRNEIEALLEKAVLIVQQNVKLEEALLRQRDVISKLRSGRSIPVKKVMVVADTTKSSDGISRPPAMADSYVGSMATATSTDYSELGSNRPRTQSHKLLRARHLVADNRPRSEGDFSSRLKDRTLGESNLTPIPDSSSQKKTWRRPIYENLRDLTSKERRK
eukprot:m.24333 g.24333  ORF g.24333 m.24333 type:complete len:665 (+) comp28607_c0_seq2:221-2215(+)